MRPALRAKLYPLRSTRRALRTALYSLRSSRRALRAALHKPRPTHHALVAALYGPRSTCRALSAVLYVLRSFCSALRAAYYSLCASPHALAKHFTRQVLRYSLCLLYELSKKYFEKSRRSVLMFEVIYFEKVLFIINKASFLQLYGRTCLNMDLFKKFYSYP